MHPGLSLKLQNAANVAFQKLLTNADLSERLKDAKLEFTLAADDCHLDTASPDTKAIIKKLVDGKFGDIDEQAALTKNAIEAVLRDKVIDESMPDFQTRGSVAG